MNPDGTLGTEVDDDKDSGPNDEAEISGTFSPGNYVLAIGDQNLDEDEARDTSTFPNGANDGGQYTISFTGNTYITGNGDTDNFPANGNSAVVDSGITVNTVDMTFDITLDTAPTAPVTVNYSVVDGTATAGEDYTALTSGSLTFAVGETSQQVTVTVNSDFAGELDENLFLELTGISPNANYDAGADAIPGGIRGTGTILTSDYAPLANPDVNFVDFKGGAGDDTVTGNVITDGAGADTLYGEGPAKVVTVTYDGTVYAIDGTTVITTPKGELTIDENGNYSYETDVQPDTSDGGGDIDDWQQVTLHAFSAGTPYEVGGVLDLSNANGTVGDGDGIGVSGGENARIDNDNALGAEALVLELDENAVTATAEVRSFGSGESMVWVAYDENLNKVAETTVTGTGNTQDITIDTGGVPFKYVAFSVPEGTNADDEYYVRNLDYTYADGIEDVFSYVIQDADGDLSNEATLTIVVDTQEPIGPLVRYR